eukprot:9504187-Pyramimonas_sp.AAC.7
MSGRSAAVCPGESASRISGQWGLQGVPCGVPVPMRPLGVVSDGVESRGQWKGGSTWCRLRWGGYVRWPRPRTNPFGWQCGCFAPSGPTTASRPPFGNARTRACGVAGGGAGGTTTSASRGCPKLTRRRCSTRGLRRGTTAGSSEARKGSARARGIVGERLASNGSTLPWVRRWRRGVLNVLHVCIVRYDELLQLGHDGEVEAVVSGARATLTVVDHEVADWPRVGSRVHLPVHGAVNADERWSEDAPESNFSFWCGALDLVGGEAEQAVVAARIRSEARKLGRIRGVVVDEVPVRSLHRPGASVQLQKGIAWLL